MRFVRFAASCINFETGGLACLAAVPSLLALAVFGVIETPDTPGYLDYARQLRDGSMPTGYALLHGAAGFVSLYRMGGFPVLLAALQSVFSANWKFSLAGLQILAQSAIAVLSFRAALRLGASRRFAFLAALLPSIGFVVVVNICVLTDSLNAAAVTGAALALVLRPDWRGALLAGLLLAVAESLREATIFLAFAYIPLALQTNRRLLCALLVLAPAWAVAGGQIAWNVSRGAGAVLTTSKQVVMVQALLPLIKDHLPVFAEDPVFAAAAAPTIGTGGYARIYDFQNLLYAQGMTPPQISAEASQDYRFAWRHFPLPMLGATVGNFRKNYLFMPFQPMETLPALIVYSTGKRPDWNRMNVMWADFRRGSVAALGVMILNIACQIIGTAISLIGLIAPWRRRAGWTMRALWCVPVGLAALYLPVHLEIRYLTPAVPIICILAAAGIRRMV